MDESALADYYERRAPSYDEVYRKPERQNDLRRLRNLLPSLVVQRDVLEVAAGTGYWTQLLATTARTVCATDVNPAPLGLAAVREYPRCNVRFEQADAFALGVLDGDFNAGFAGFWWSHLQHDQIDKFLRGLSTRLGRRSRVIFVDNRYVEGSSSPLVRADTAGNTYQRRALSDGTEFEVLKNFPSADDLIVATEPWGTEASVLELEYYWLLTFTTH